MLDFVPQLTEQEFRLLERTATAGERVHPLEEMRCLAMLGDLADRGLLLFHVRPRSIWRSVTSIVEALVDRPGPAQTDDGRPRPSHTRPLADDDEVLRRIYLEVVAARLGWIPGSPWGAA